MDWKVPLSDLDFGPEEETEVIKVMRSRWLTMGSVTQEFEQRFAEMTGARHAFAVSNGTHALHLACVALGIGPGDEVIVPSLTFVATANAVLYTGASVRFADISGPDDLTVSPEKIEKQITPKTKAIMVMHYAGYPCKMNAIREIASRNNLAIIEDCAHSPGASLDGVSLGTWGDVGCFSFFSNKNLAVGEGGMVITNRDDVAEKLKYLRSHGMTTLTWDRHKGHASTYDVVELGYNYRIDEIRAAIGLIQLKKLRNNNSRREHLTHCYQNALQGTGIKLPFLQVAGQPSYHIFPVLLPEQVERLAVIEYMKDNQIQTSIHYPPIHTFTFYRKQFADVSLPNTEDVAKREITLPLYPTMSENDIDLVVSTLSAAIHH